VAATLRDMIYVWRGDLALTRAIDEGRLEAHGTSAARHALPRWFGISRLAHLQSARADARAA
jgi:hypothetical protein